MERLICQDRLGTHLTPEELRQKAFSAGDKLLEVRTGTTDQHGKDGGDDAPGSSWRQQQGRQR
eukprot:COSAG06_NODE_3698_length_4997_cov_1.758677_6_plen_63_part_00